MLTIHRAERADRLVHALAEVLVEPTADPFTPEVVAVPSRGVERWISQTLALRLGAGSEGGDGVCANVAFPSPSRLVADALASAGGVDPDQDPWAPHRLPWLLLEAIDECAGEPWCRPLGIHLGVVGDGDREHRRGRRVEVAQKLAALFTSYGAQRPAMVRGWVTDDPADLSDVDDDLRWQAQLFVRLRRRIGTPSPAERLEPACQALRSDGAAVGLPERLSIFGPTRLTVDQFAVLDALGVHRDVHLWLPHPSPGLWERVAAVETGGTERRADPTATLARHPLLASLARDARELQLLLRQHVPAADVRHHALDRGEDEPVDLLHRLQRDLHDDRTPHGDLELTEGDRSVQVHSCHGRLRQVEVLREVLLTLLQDDPTLELRDIVVMCPDIEAFAPLVSATFGLVDDDDAGWHPGHRLRVRLADRSLRQVNPLLSVLARLLDFADARLSASELLDFAALGPVRRRFRLDDEGLELVADWVRRSGVRWGLDAEARAPYRLDSVPHNTWERGLDRLLLGVAMDETDLRTFGGVLPLDDVDSGDIDLAGRFAELVTSVGAAVRSMRDTQPLLGWVRTLEGALDDLTDVAPGDGWQVTQARAQLAGAVESAGERASGAPLGLADVRALFAERLRGRPTRANFRTGHLTICSMVPMRSVPHRVVCLLGLDDQAFPRSTHADGDNVLGRRPHVGERDPRAEDRQLFLDAILAAEERLVLLYSGHDERTGAPRPPAVPLGELLDVLDGTATVTSGRVRDRVVVAHPLQPFDPRNFEPGRLVAGTPFSFDPAAVRGAQALGAARRPRGRFLDVPLASLPEGTVELDDLVAFLEHPVRAFLRRRLGLTFTGEATGPADELAVELGGLDEWQVGNRLLRAGLSGQQRQAAVAAEVARGDLPPGPLGRTALEGILDSVAALVDRSSGLRAAAPAATVDVDVQLPSGLRLLGTVPNVHGRCAVRLEYSKLKPKHRLVGWLTALALTANDPAADGDPWRSIVAGRADRSGIAWSHVTGLPRADALQELDSLVDLYLLGMTQPLPLTELGSATYAERRDKGAPPDDAAAKAQATWRKVTAAGQPYGEQADAAHRCVWGEAAFTELLREPADPAEARPGTTPEPHRFGTLARRLWQPLLDAEAKGNG